MGGVRLVLAKVSGSVACAAKIGIMAMISGNSRSPTPERSKRMRWGLSTSTALTCPKVLRWNGLPFFFSISNVKRTSSAVRGCPSENRARGSRLKVIFAPVIGHFDRAGDEAIERKGLVLRADHQALQHVSRDRIGRDAQHDERVEAVERALQTENDSAAPGSIRVRIGQPLRSRRRARVRHAWRCRDVQGRPRRRRLPPPAQRTKRQYLSAIAASCEPSRGVALALKIHPE